MTYTDGPIKDAYRVLSFGGGVQSTTLALMAAHGEIGPIPDLVIFADTGAEPKPVMDHIKWLNSGNVLPFKIETVSHDHSLTEALERRADPDNDSRFTAAPFFTSTGGMGRRQCTREFKVDVIAKAIRQKLGYKPRARIPVARVEQWIGISTDELVRATPNRKRWIANRFPLLEKRMSRYDCELWLERNGYPVPMKSACTFCPYRSNAEWRDLKQRDPEGFEEACRVDEMIRQAPRLKAQEYVHRSLKPLQEADLRSDEDKAGQFNLICEGGCGL